MSKKGLVAYYLRKEYAPNREHILPLKVVPMSIENNLEKKCQN